jgi:hypothetical protein
MMNHNILAKLCTLNAKQQYSLLIPIKYVGWLLDSILVLFTYKWCVDHKMSFRLGSVWLKRQVERSRSVSVWLLFGYKVTRTEWLQLENILLRSGTIPLQKINGTEPLRSQPTPTACSLIRAQQLARLPLQPNKKQSRSVPVHSATKQKTEPLRSNLPNTEQSSSVPIIRDGTAPFYLALQPNTT